MSQSAIADVLAHKDAWLRLLETHLESLPTDLRETAETNGRWDRSYVEHEITAMRRDLDALATAASGQDNIFNQGLLEGYRRVAETMRTLTRTMTLQWLQNELQEPPAASPPADTKGIDCPVEIIDVRRNADGTLDEVVAENCFVHLEQMDERHFWLGVSKAGYRQSIRLFAGDNGMILATSEMDDWPAHRETRHDPR